MQSVGLGRHDKGGGGKAGGGVEDLEERRSKLPCAFLLWLVACLFCTVLLDVLEVPL